MKRRREPVLCTCPFSSRFEIAIKKGGSFMHRAGRQESILGVSALTAVLLISGCASKKYVREQVSAIDPTIAAINKQAGQNTERIDAVDVLARQGITDAARAQASASTADTWAGCDACARSSHAIIGCRGACLCRG
jgi:hypothetical protein